MKTMMVMKIMKMTLVMVNGDYEDASDEADGKELATFPLGTKLSADNLKIYS